MEANEAPEKLYLSKNIYRTYLYQVPDNNDKSNIEYTRADAVIEKACIDLKKLMYDNLMFQGRLCREEVINNFVEDFKKNLHKM